MGTEQCDLVNMESITIYVDGSCEPNDGSNDCIAGVGYYCEFPNGEYCQNGTEIGRGRQYTNNAAEYEAVIFGLEYLLREGISSKVLVLSDSRLVVQQLNKKWRVKNLQAKYIKSYERAAQLLSKFSSIRVEWIPGRENLADIPSRWHLPESQQIKVLNSKAWKSVPKIKEPRGIKVIKNKYSQK